MPPPPTNISLRAAGGTVALSATGEYASATSASASTSPVGRLNLVKLEGDVKPKVVGTSILCLL